ncbi:MAG: NUDIX domain-containing protein [Rhodobacteraceae bacterium]|nr:NUDIX domain-containing protein [Paracoccaceae bacterium]
MRWKTLSSDLLLARDPFLRVTQDRVEIRPGEIIDDFYQIEMRDFALVIPFLRDGRIQLIRQYKHGPRREVLSFPAGHVDPGEDPATTARRELMEETGLAPAHLEPLGSLVDHGNQRVCVGHFYVAHDCDRLRAPDPGDLEDFAYEALTPEEVDEEMRTGAFGVMHHVAAWGQWRLHAKS